MGTPGYLSPEQARGDSAAAGPQADVFALGVILYQILTGQEPFAGDTVRESILHAIHRRPQDPRRLNLWVSRSLAAVCRKALEKDPSRRYRNAGALAADLRSYHQRRRVSVTRPSPLERAWGWTLRRPGRAALTLAVAASLLLLALFVGVQVWIDRQLAEKAFESIAATDAEIADLDLQQRALPAGPSVERRELAARRLVREFEAMALLVNVARLRFIRTSDEVLALGRARMFETLESSLANDEPELAKAFASTVLARAGAGATLLEYSPSEIERLRALVAEADAAMARRSDPSPHLPVE